MPVTINGTTGISGVDGSNTTPAVRGGTSSSNGVFYGTNTVSIATNGTTAVTVDSSQNVGIGTTSPSTNLDVVTTGNYAAKIYKGSCASSGTLSVGNNQSGDFRPLYLENSNTGATPNGMIYINNANTTATGWSFLNFYSANNGTQRFQVSGTGAIFSSSLTGGATTLSVDASGTIIRTPSDRNLKINDKEIPYGIADIQKMRPVIHEWTEEANMGDGKSIGFIAQEMEKIIPEVISGIDFKSLDYSKLTAVLVKAIQELSAKNDALEARIAALEAN
jgi:hypothetical protein